MTSRKTPVVMGTPLEEYFYSHVKPTKHRRIFKVVKPLHVFKKVEYYTQSGFTANAIANLVIPVGALVYAHRFLSTPSCRGESHPGDFNKMRASKAFVHSIAAARTGRKLDRAHSYYTPRFIYTPGKTVKPANKFFMRHETCASGIHFFLNLRHALNY